MQLAPFLLDQWLDEHAHTVEINLASSTGPSFTFRELLDVMTPEERERLFAAKLLYSRSGGADDLRQAVAERHGVSAEDVLILTGASEGLLILSFLAGEPGANVVLPSPGYPPSASIPRGFGIEARTYALRPENGFRVDLDEVRSLVDAKTKYVLVNSPHNPTGATLSDDELDALHAFTAGRGIPLVCDEVYHPIYHGTPSRSAARLPGAVVLGDMSKALCLSGLRIGWMIERDAVKRAQVLNARQYFTITNAPLEEALATAAVRRAELLYEGVRRRTAENLAQLEPFFAAQAGTLSWVRPRGGMTAFPRLLAGDDARPFCVELARAGVLVAPGDCFGMPAHFRLGFGAAPPDRLLAGLERLAQVCAAVGAS